MHHRHLLVNTIRGLLLSMAGLAAGAAAASGPPLPPEGALPASAKDFKPVAMQPPGRTIAYALYEEYWGMYESPEHKEECPKGFNLLGPREQFKLLYPENKKRTVVDTQLAYESGVWFPEDWHDPFPFIEATGRFAPGVNLDGKVKPTDFTAPDDGEVGVDNQLYRVIGCVRNFRREGELGIITTKWRVQHKYNRVVFELTGVDSLANDPDVTVTYYRTLDPLMTDSTGQNYLPGGSQTIDERWGRQFTRTFKGKIVNGVLTTEPVPEFWLPEMGAFDVTPLLLFRDMRLKLRLTPQRAEGVIAGYSDVEEWYTTLNRGWATHHQSYGQSSAPSIYQALVRLADGHPDPKTGRFTSISSSMLVKLSQVFVVHPQDEGKLLTSTR